MDKLNTNIISAILENKEGFVQVNECIENDIYFIIDKNKKTYNFLYVGTYKNKTKYDDNIIYNFTIFENLLAIYKKIEPTSFSFDPNAFIFAKYTSIYSNSNY